MADEEHAQTSRKRVADKQINKDNPELDDDSPEQEGGTFKKASEEVMATRKIVKVRRQQPSSAPSSNPFSAIKFTTSDSSVQASIPVSKPPPSDVTTSNVRSSTEKADEVSNGSGKDDVKTADSNEVAEIQKDESGLNESNAENKSNAPMEAHSSLTETDKKAGSTEGGTGEDKVLVGEPKVDNSKTSGIEGKTEDEGVKVNEGGDEDKSSKDGAEKKDESESGTKDVSCEQKNADNKGQSSSPTPLFSFMNVSSGHNAFTGLAGTGFSASSFSFGSASKESTNAPLFGLKSDGLSFPSFNMGGTNNNGSSVPSLVTAAEAPKKFTMPEVPVETGEENEMAVFTADSAMYEYLDGGWKERGKGELKLNVPVSGGERSRLVMRAKGNYRLILNASLYDDMALKDMEKKGVTFACVNSTGDSPTGLTTFALKFKDTGVRDDFKAAVEAHKAKKASDAMPKTPESSPKVSND
ncbi:nuclear pore complex protein NUP50A-like isoform X2 [Triticum dicoccoides]|uniref:nuclear pore complex protein NUP50A-like isoform X2 n=1 Tax=Triticum dicoccoides TaxID=85692 RepID=UPI001890FAB6|nr:nuclear pore complex protein NUP50A-like isoform X2 [Triticum dicoccoides]